jgi:hypothetical protein
MVGQSDDADADSTGRDHGTSARFRRVATGARRPTTAVRLGGMWLLE